MIFVELFRLFVKRNKLKTRFLNVIVGL